MRRVESTIITNYKGFKAAEWKAWLVGRLPLWSWKMQVFTKIHPDLSVMVIMNHRPISSGRAHRHVHQEVHRAHSACLSHREGSGLESCGKDGLAVKMVLR